MIGSFRKLRKAGVLGINQRNADYILHYNDRKLYPLVDDKLITKRLAIKHAIHVPELYDVVEIQHQINKSEIALSEREQFVIKPAHGSGGNGILVIKGRVGKYYRKANGDLISSGNLQHYISNIISGMYSLSGHADQAIIEYCVNIHNYFNDFSYQGVPDIRVIMFRGIPVAAMLRLPTRESDGKANLHQGAIGVGINISTGQAISGVLNNRITTLHPDTGLDTRQIHLPMWQDILKLAIRCADMVGLQYLGVDIVVDDTQGPLMLELNARPGLNVQLANKQGLLHKLKAIEAMNDENRTAEQRYDIALEL